MRAFLSSITRPILGKRSLPDNEDVSADQVQKGMAHDDVQGARAAQEVGGSAKEKPAAIPSVVIPWVFKELVDCDDAIRENKELWPEVIGTLFESESIWLAESAEGVKLRERIECLLDCLMTWSNSKIPFSGTRDERIFDSYVPSDPSVKNALAFRKAIKQALGEVKKVKLHKEIAAAKASLKAAPWETDSTSNLNEEQTTS
ncbi:hypothetical protein KFL_009220020 [Klebsormidium nitens]|uniref:Uncharacterized protein n=1 Tax=Klebsormidium nitens TaxID=105231 RepID=A0A1Y1IN68_KLENI|nr:hypothetical protein KFL_009220020 [Klebsormidium nitens]|eukprot:GAQ92103.1 hypothetical protein KFL_009220020 [Klebsormidium nitens]